MPMLGEGVMMTNYIEEEDLSYRTLSHFREQRLCLSDTSEGARASAHEHFATATLERRLPEGCGHPKPTAGGRTRQETRQEGPPVELMSLCFPGELREAFSLESAPPDRALAGDRV
jgi:hypothetical protein